MVLRDVAKNDPVVRKHLTPREIEEVFDYHYHTKHISDIFKRLGI